MPTTGSRLSETVPFYQSESLESSAKRSRKSLLKRVMFNQFKHQLLSVEIFMVNSMIYLSFLRKVERFQTPDIFSWVIL